MKLKDYWPRCLQDLVEFQQIANAEQPEFETALGDVRTAADDFFLATLSEYGCQRWEAIMGLHTADGDTLEARRERILIKYLDQLPYTYRTLLKYLKTITDDFTVTHQIGGYELTFEHCWIPGDDMPSRTQTGYDETITFNAANVSWEAVQ